MSPQQTEKIFEPFQSNFEGGTGLGLAVVYQIVQAHEGKVWARSKPGQGTTFVLRLRRLDAERIATEKLATEKLATEKLATEKLAAERQAVHTTSHESFAAPVQLAAAAGEGRLRG
jgi:K+-sensing histidine kinase KdpD